MNMTQCDAGFLSAFHWHPWAIGDFGSFKIADNFFPTLHFAFVVRWMQ